MGLLRLERRQAAGDRRDRVLGDEAPIGDRLRAWWGDAPYDREDWWEFEKFRDPERG